MGDFPRFATIPLGAGFAAMTNFSQMLPLWAQIGGFWIGVVLFVWGIGALIWHYSSAKFPHFTHLALFIGYAPSRISFLDFWAIAQKKLRLEMSKDAYFLAQSVRQPAVDGSLTLFGREIRHGWDTTSAVALHPLVHIPSEYFKNHWLDINGPLQTGDNTKTHTYKPGGGEKQFYSDIYVDRIQGLRWLRKDAEQTMAVIRRGQ